MGCRKRRRKPQEASAMQVSTGHSSDSTHPAGCTPVIPFSSLSGEARAQFEAIATETSYVRGTRIFAEDEAPKSIFILSSGRLKLSVTSQEGKTVILRIAGAGDLLGLSAVLAGNTHEVTAEVLEPCRATVIRATDFVAFLKKHPEASMEATRCMLNEYQ